MFVGAAAVALIAGVLPAAVAAPVGPVFVDEDFTGATAVPEFEGYGSACLTGAPAVGAIGAGQHELGGCPGAAIGPVPPAGGSPDGFLRLTDASVDQAGAVLYTEPLASAQGVSVSFEQWQYGGTTNPPADGISFFLVDGVTVLDQPGAFGGSLGYAQKLPDNNPNLPFIPGVEGGYLGVGFDVLGNYFGDWERRSNGCATGSPAGNQLQGPPVPGENKVTVRGPGSGIEGYCLLAATSSNMTTTGPWPSTLPGRLHGGPLVIPPGTSAEVAAGLIQPLGRTVTIDITPSPDPVVTVSIDFHDGAGVQQVLQFAAPTPVPETYKFGFAASTGSFTDVHLIRNVRVRAIDGTASITKTDAETGMPVAGATIDILDSTGSVVATVSTTAEPTVISLSEGEYTAVETQAPPGYMPDATPVPFAITDGSLYPVPVVLADYRLPAIASSATAEQYAGFPIGDTATVTGHIPPGGMTLAFAAYGPSATPVCTDAPAFESTPVTITTAGTYPLGDRFAPTNPGGYHWVATLQSAATNTTVAGVCGDPGETSTVVAVPGITTEATPTVILGAPISDSASVTGTVISGTAVEFDLYGPEGTPACETQVFTGAPIPVTGPGSYPGPEYTPTAAGSYHWVARLLTPDGQPLVSHECGIAGETSVVFPATVPPQPNDPGDSGREPSDTADLAATGSGRDPTATAAVGLILLCVGVGMTAWRRTLALCSRSRSEGSRRTEEMCSSAGGANDGNRTRAISLGS